MPKKRTQLAKARNDTQEIAAIERRLSSQDEEGRTMKEQLQAIEAQLTELKGLIWFAYLTFGSR